MGVIEPFGASGLSSTSKAVTWNGAWTARSDRSVDYFARRLHCDGCERKRSRPAGPGSHGPRSVFAGTWLGATCTARTTLVHWISGKQSELSSLEKPIRDKTFLYWLELWILQNIVRMKSSINIYSPIKSCIWQWKQPSVFMSEDVIS